MHSLKSAVFAAIAIVMPAATFVDASVVNYGLFATNYHWQYSTGSPTNAYACTFNGRVISTNPADFSSAAVVHTTSITPPMFLTDYGSEWMFTSAVYGTPAQRNAAFPTGLYAFQVSGGTLGSTTAFRSFPTANLFPVNPPYILNVSELQAVDARSDLQIAPGVFVVPAGAVGYTYLAIFDGAGNLVATGDSPPNVGAFTLPGNILMPSQRYTVSLYFSCRVHSDAAGFAGASSDAGWDAVTSTYLTTNRTCGSSDYNGDGDYGTDQDIEAFFACLAGFCCQSCWSGGSDFNGDGDSGTDQDIEAFFRVLSGASCGG